MLSSWKHRFHVVGLDLRDSLAIEEFCRMILARFKRVDILINNACQVRVSSVFVPAMAVCPYALVWEGRTWVYDWM
jgi:NADP-dependent 3-hydroxy acid dehydrogenase YdfG